MSNRHRTWLLLILLVAFMLRLAFLGSKSIWLDEAFSVWQTERTPNEIWNTVNDNHPPMYYLLLQAWMYFGKSEAIIRLPSVLVSMTGLVLLSLLARRLFNQQVALFAVALLALAPIDLWYAQEARMVLFVAPAALLIALGLSKMGWSGAVLITVGLALGLYFDYTIIPLWGILSGIWFAQWWKGGHPINQLATWFVASLLAWLIFMPLWPHLQLVASRMSGIYVFANIREVTGLPDFGVLLPVIALIFLGIGTAVLAWLTPQILSRPSAGQIVAALSIVTFFLLTALMPIPRLYTIKRLVVTGWPIVVLGVAWIALNKVRKPRPVIFVLITISFIATLVILLAVPKDDWRSAVSYINEHAGPGDITWLDPSHGRIPYNYYEPTVDILESSKNLEVEQNASVWHVAERQPNRPIPGSEVEIWLDENMQLVEVVPLYRLELRRYSPVE